MGISKLCYSLNQISPARNLDDNDNHSTISTTEKQNQRRPRTWPSYLQKRVMDDFFSTPTTSLLPLFLRYDTWSLSSLSEDGGTCENNNTSLKQMQMIASSLSPITIAPSTPKPNHYYHFHQCRPHHHYHVTGKFHHCTTIPDAYFGHCLKTRDLIPAKTFHTQSLLFLFGFLFFPCWWYGWYLSNKDDGDQVHAPCCASYLTASGPYFSPTSLYHDIYCFSRFNRFLSFVSIFLLLFILALLVWYYYGTIHHW